jgi:hypothetical protein
MDPSFFNNPVFSNMSPEKMQFLLDFAAKDKPVSMKDAMPFLLANLREAKKLNLDFTKPEIQLICELLSKDLPPAQQEQVKKLMAMLQR